MTTNIRLQHQFHIKYREVQDMHQYKKLKDIIRKTQIPGLIQFPSNEPKCFTFFLFS